MRIGVYVGSFDPIHKGHKEIVNHLISKKYVDKVLIIPTGNYWDKNKLINLNDRINMAKYYEDNNIKILDKYNNMPYTYMILDKLREDNSKDNYYLIIGGDNIKSFYLWKEVDKIINNNYILVVPRGNVNYKEYINKFKKSDKFILVSDFNIVNICSSDIREMIKNNDIDVLKYIDNEIYLYIKDNRLYEE